ncbi:Protein of unknown function [Halomicrobium zhouii]|uniref:DUF421 domain-containing protein n=1 Tax=Halomicrobium zhouii TaxID=767519 RepID=A0A1I6M2X7_9EURY|nr:YetF domain-containing protein [Halomicrobium zhouii]SFS10067.1 Protein of unknown function [Halomicrobium zhouii]
MTEVTFFVSGWNPLVRIVVVGVSMYVALVLFLRLSGSRTLSSMNAFDFIVTVAIGSVFGRALTAKDVALSEAIVAFGLLVALQYVVTWIQIRWPFFRRVVTNPPALLYFRGEFVDRAMRQQRVTESEIKSAVRKKQFGSVDEVEAVVLESSGEFSVIGSVEDEPSFGEQLEEQLWE